MMTVRPRQDRLQELAASLHGLKPMHIHAAPFRGEDCEKALHQAKGTATESGIGNNQFGQGGVAESCFGHHRSRGFTLIELLLAVTIITILTAIAVPMGLRWLTDYRFTQAVRSLSNAVLMARMRGIENRSVITITSSQITTASPFSTSCPGVIFTTNVDHGLTQPNPVVASALVDPTTLTPPSPPASLPSRYLPISNCKCAKDFGTPPSTTPIPGDTVMISGLDHTMSMNGTEFEVLTIPSANQFAVQHTFSIVVGDIAGADTTGTVRNLVAPGRLRIIPAVAKINPDPAKVNEEAFSSSGYTVKEEASNIVFRYNTDEFQVTFFPGNPPVPSANVPLDPSSTTNNFAEIRFDNRGVPFTTLAFDGSSNMVTKAVSTNTTIVIAEKVSGSSNPAPRSVQYLISPAGKVNTAAWEE